MNKFFALLIYLLAATAFANESEQDTFWRIQQDISMQRHQLPMPSHSTALPAENQESEPSDWLILQAINQNDTEQLSQQLTRHQHTTHPDMLLFAQASLAAQQGKIEQAIKLYRQLLNRHPHFVRARLDLARLLFINKQNKESTIEFTTAKQATSHPAVQAKAQQFIDALQQRDAWHGAFALGGQTISNLEQSSDSTIHRQQTICPPSDSPQNTQCIDVDIPISTPPAQRAHGLLYEAAADKRISIQGHHGIRWNAYASGNVYPQHSANNEHYLSTSFGYDYEDQNHVFSLRPAYRLTLKGAAIQKTSAGIQLEASRQWSPNLYQSLWVDHQYEHYHADEHQRFNGPQTSLMFYTSAALPNGLMFYGSYDYLNKQSHDPVDSYHRHGLRAGISRSFPSWQLQLESSIRNTQYHAYHAWLGVRRRDTQYIYRLSAHFPKLSIAKLTPSVEYIHTNNRSNSWIHNYSNRQWLIKWRRAF